MKIAIVADFKNNSKLTRLAKATLSHAGNKLNMVGCNYSNYKNQDNVDVAIQFLPVEKFNKIPNCLNIGVILDANDRLSTYSSLVDERWDDYPLICEHIDQSSIHKTDIPQIDGEYIFYTINNNYDASNIDLLIKAFNLEFDPAEPVNLVIKTNKIIDDEIVRIKNRLSLYQSISNYKKHVIISKSIDELQIRSLHKTYDCFVITDNESDSAEANSFGNCVINLHNDFMSVNYLRDELRHVYMTRKHKFDFTQDTDIVTYLLTKLGK